MNQEQGLIYLLQWRLVLTCFLLAISLRLLILALTGLKVIRIENLNVRDDLLVDIVAKEHNDTAYVIDAPPSDLVAAYNTDQEESLLLNLFLPLI